MTVSSTPRLACFVLQTPALLRPCPFASLHLRRPPRSPLFLPFIRYAPSLSSQPPDLPSTPSPSFSPSASLPLISRHFPPLLSGLTASTIGSLIGAGGGIVLTPLLTLLSVSQHAAHGTSLVVVSATALVSALRYGTSAQVDVPAALALMASALLTAPIGARASARLDSRRLRRCFGAFLIFVAGLIPLLPLIASTSGLSLPALWKYPLLAVLGCGSGFLSGLLGIGGGTVNVPALVLLAGFPQKVAQGTALMAMVLPSVRGGYAHLKLGQVRADLLPGLVVGALAGGFFGASAAVRMPDKALRVVCAGVFAAMGVRYLLPGRQKR